MWFEPLKMRGAALKTTLYSARGVTMHFGRKAKSCKTHLRSVYHAKNISSLFLAPWHTKFVKSSMIQFFHVMRMGIPAVFQDIFHFRCPSPGWPNLLLTNQELKIRDLPIFSYKKKKKATTEDGIDFV